MSHQKFIESMENYKKFIESMELEIAYYYCKQQMLIEAINMRSYNHSLGPFVSVLPFNVAPEFEVVITSKFHKRGEVFQYEGIYTRSESCSSNGLIKRLDYVKPDILVILRNMRADLKMLKQPFVELIRKTNMDERQLLNKLEQANQTKFQLIELFEHEGLAEFERIEAC